MIQKRAVAGVAGGRLYNHQVDVTESWFIDVRGVVPALPMMPLRDRFQFWSVPGAVLDIVVRKTTVGRRTRITVILLGDDLGDQDNPRDRPSVESSSGSSRRLTGLPASFRRIIAEQTGMT